ncbi:TRAP transporter substrate-binding protein DctP [Oceanimonas sp. CHS3-5]|uniref:TRAP transporter substrate-binding protein DctP n=1 Tax=Oceanimonas sp. CHS3-5 TaxID=3068186 RepID=UPI00273EEBF2|nr:TRAP transporter substrate-binding protein DctP [Oceanimonas sp. CHS3-5]MDP5292867.1 TRAP transporter substrate-binding protein DctP [Oceanimonas sp. CHS3-5]
MRETFRNSRHCVLGAILTLLGGLGPAWAGAPLNEAPTPSARVLRISTENTADHVQTRAIARFAERLERASEGRLKVQFHHSARLFRDRDVIAALAGGKVEMAVPGMWQLDRYVPDVGLYMLPMFYGLPAVQHYRVRDGDIGRRVSARIERDLGVVVPGRWLDLGYAHLYFTDTRVGRHADLAGLRIRIPGGAANRGRLEAFEAGPVLIPWPDLPDALEQGRVQGLLSTHETVRSAELWNQGVRFGFEDREYFAQYVPMISARFWQSLPEELRRLVRDSWEPVVDAQRSAAAEAQHRARRVLQEHGVDIATPSEASLARWRGIARRLEPALVREMGLDPELVQQAQRVVLE